MFRDIIARHLQRCTYFKYACVPLLYTQFRSLWFEWGDFLVCNDLVLY